MDKFINTGFIGEYEHTLDEKGRVSVPAKFKKHIEEITKNPEARNKVILTMGDDECVSVFPVEEWGRMVTQYNQEKTLKDLNKSSDYSTHMRRFFSAFPF